MKMRFFTILLILLFVSTVYLPLVYAQDYTTWGLPEGAKLRLGKGSIEEIAYSPDGTRLAVASNIGIWIYDAQTGEELNLFTGHRKESGNYPQTPPGAGPKSVLSVSFSPNGQTLASGSVDDTIRLWDVRTGDLLRTLTGHTKDVYSVAFSPDGKTLATGSQDRTIRLWDVRIGETILILTEHGNDRVFSVSFSPDGQTLATGSEGTIHLWDVRTGNLLRTLTGHPRSGYNTVSVSLSPDGKTLASASGRWGGGLALDGTIHLWDVRTGDLLHTLTGHTWYEHISVSFSPDGNTLASASGDLRLWDVSTGDLLGTPTGHTEDVYSVLFSPDGNTLASASRQEIRLWDVSTGDTLRTLTGHTGGVRVINVSLSPDGNTLASAGRDSWGEDSWSRRDGRIRLWDVSTGDLLRTLRGHDADVYSVSFSPDGQTLASGGFGHDSTVRLWDVRTGDTLRTLRGHTDTVYSVAFSADGQTLVSGSGDGTTRLWNVRTGDTIRTLTGRIWSVSSDWQTLATGGYGDGTTRLWDVGTGDLLRTFTGTGGIDTVRSVSFSPDGQTLASGGEKDHRSGRIHLWDVATGELLHTMGLGEVSSVAFSPDGQTLAGINDGTNTIYLWDVGTGDLLRTLIVPPWEDVYSVAFSPDGQTLTSVGEFIHLWDVATGELLHTLNPGGPLAYRTAFGLDWQTVANASRGDSTVVLWEFTPTSPHPGVNAADVNGDGEVNIQDLVAVAAALGQTGENIADVNGDGEVNIQDLVAVAAALGQAAAAPAAICQQATGHLTTADVQQWLIQAQQLDLTDSKTQRGLLFLQHLLVALTPQETILLANYPNPFNPETWIPYQLATPADVNIAIYAVDGTLVRTLALGHQPVGIYEGKSRAAFWDGKNSVGEFVASGVYFYTLTAGEFTATRKMLIRK